MKHAFSLVELSIVLVILGLLTGGILTGQSLIRASELRSVTTEYQRYITATQTFRDKYFALPGDMNNATRFWGDDNAACADAAIPNGTPGTCNGNGNGGLEWAGASATGERFQFWKHLSLAGVIEGTYSGLAGSNASGLRVPTFPAQKLVLLHGQSSQTLRCIVDLLLLMAALVTAMRLVSVVVWRAIGPMPLFYAQKKRGILTPKWMMEGQAQGGLLRVIGITHVEQAVLQRQIRQTQRIIYPAPRCNV